MELHTVGILLLGLALLVGSIQLRAHRCHRHQKIAGLLAWIIVAFCGVSGVILLWYM